ncbi:hypothetical protein [uncultured Amnibacterium sp.]|uniref:hypothetical protein n=1 Tax=uncultured Amnibacterium sp. TaxID=1631851 RepID=UPI0035CA6259
MITTELIERAAADPSLRRVLPRVHIVGAPDRTSVDGPPLPCEPMWTPLRGRAHGGGHPRTFIGCITGGVSDIAEIGSVGVRDSAELVDLLTPLMCARCFTPSGAIREMERLLQQAAQLEEGTLVRLGARGELVPLGPDEVPRGVRSLLTAPAATAPPRRG